MMKRIGLNLPTLLLVLALAGTCLAQNSKTSAAERDFQRFDGNQSGWLSGRELIECQCKSYDRDGDNEVTKAEFFAGRGVPLQSNNVTDENGARPQPAPAAEVKETETKANTTADCSFTAPPADISKTAKPSEELFKRKIYDRYNVLANGTASAPLRVGVTFLSFQVSKPFANTVRVDPVRGALRINDAAPVNATIYPVHSEHIVCEQYRDATQRKRVDNKYACFKNRDGEWVCGADGIPKTISLN